MTEPPRKSSRRELLSSLQSPAAHAPAGSRESNGDAKRQPPAGGSTIRLSARAMACDFSVILNPSTHPPIESAGEALERIHAAETWMSIYREHSEMSVVNRSAAHGPVTVSQDFLRLLESAFELFRATDGGFDLAAGRLTTLWRTARKSGSLPTPEQVLLARESSGFIHVRIAPDARTVEFTHPSLMLDPGAIGKGFALDDAANWLASRPDAPTNFLLHGGHSSLLAKGTHGSHDGWPVGLGNPLLTEKRMATVLLRDQAMGTSGSNIQFFRHGGRRYGHILNPETGWPAEGVLSVTIFARSAATADALSTAFFAIGPEKAVECCRRMPEIGCILTPMPDRGTVLRPLVFGVSPDRIFWDEQQVQPQFLDLLPPSVAKLPQT
jgi:thiamine biosynthesis lipoprotein